MKQRKARKSKIKINKWRLALFFGVVILAVIAIFLAYFYQSKENTYHTYFIKNDGLEEVESRLAKGDDPLQKVLIRLIKGPSIMERTQGVSTYLPPKTRINGIKRQGDVLIIDFNTELGNITGGTDRIVKMIEQIVYTATDVPGIKKVWIWINGNKKLLLGGEGFELFEPVGRGEIENGD